MLLLIICIRRRVRLAEVRIKSLRLYREFIVITSYTQRKRVHRVRQRAGLDLITLFSRTLERVLK